MFKKMKENPNKTKKAFTLAVSSGLIMYGLLTIYEIFEEGK